MKFETFQEHLQSFIDGELDETLAQKISEQIRTCPMSKMAYDEAVKFDNLIRNHIKQEEAPFELRETVVQQIENTRSWKEWLKNIFKTPVPVTVFSSLAIAVLAFGIYSQTRPFPVFAASVERHVECMAGALPIEIKSNDINEVKQWFKGKLAFAVNVPDFKGKNMQLTGARLCHLGDRTVAFLMFEKDGHDVSLFVMDKRGVRIPPSKKIDRGQQTFYVKDQRGYKSILCLNKQNQDTGTVLVSDLPEEEILQLVRL